MTPKSLFRQRASAAIALSFSLALAGPTIAVADNHALDARTSAAIDAAMAGDHRSANNKARDQFRRPKETLEFFGFRSDMTVVEFSPGGGWYTEVLAPALRDSGKLYAAHYGMNSGNFQRRSLGGFLRKMGESADVYDQVVVTTISVGGDEPIAPLNSADMVVTFRNAHNWVTPGAGGEANAIATFTEMHKVLKPGGILGVVDHRWPDPATEDPDAGNGYLSEERVIRIAEAAGFEHVATSEHLRNSKDTHDHPNGVWTLPPELDAPEGQEDRYRSIGESDRWAMTFRKP